MCVCVSVTCVCSSVTCVCVSVMCVCVRHVCVCMCMYICACSCVHTGLQSTLSWIDLTSFPGFILQAIKAGNDKPG